MSYYLEAMKALKDVGLAGDPGVAAPAAGCCGPPDPDHPPIVGNSSTNCVLVCAIQSLAYIAGSHVVEGKFTIACSQTPPQNLDCSWLAVISIWNSTTNRIVTTPTCTNGLRTCGKGPLAFVLDAPTILIPSGTYYAVLDISTQTCSTPGPVEICEFTLESFTI